MRPNHVAGAFGAARESADAVGFFPGVHPLSRRAKRHARVVVWFFDLDERC
jgi:hypothetical protein